MNTIKQDELFENVSQFFRGKGIELKDGAYTQRIRNACGLLSDAINATQRTASNAKAQVDKTLDQLRQTVHEATAAKPPPVDPAPANGSASETAAQAQAASASASASGPAPSPKKKKAVPPRKGSTPAAGSAAPRSGKSKRKI